jgi:hypothetical protein
LTRPELYYAYLKRLGKFFLEEHSGIGVIDESLGL